MSSKRGAEEEACGDDEWGPGGWGRNRKVSRHFYQTSSGSWNRRINIMAAPVYHRELHDHEKRGILLIQRVMRAWMYKLRHVAGDVAILTDLRLSNVTRTSKMVGLSAAYQMASYAHRERVFYEKHTSLAEVREKKVNSIKPKAEEPVAQYFWQKG